VADGQAEAHLFGAETRSSVSSTGPFNKRISLILLALIMDGCGARVTNARYAGEPIATLNGQFLAATAEARSAPVRLAMVWYPALAASTQVEVPAAVVDQNVAFQGTFPIGFTFKVYAPPPASALVDLSDSGGSGHASYGLLVAYEDRNGNGTLDLVPPDGPPIDKLLGISTADPSLPPPPRYYFVIYLDGNFAPGDYFDAFDLQQGFNLLETHNDYGVLAVPLSTPIPVRLTGSGGLDYFVCTQRRGPGWPSRACGIDPYDGRYQARGGISVLYSSFYIHNENGAVTNATLRINGRLLVYDPMTDSYLGPGGTPGMNQIEVLLPGYPMDTLFVTIPERPMVTAPVGGGTYGIGSALTIAWQSATGAQEYSVRAVSESNPSPYTQSGKWLFHTVVPQDSLFGYALTTPPVTVAGRASVSVNAIGKMAVGASGSFVTPVSFRSVEVAFVP
jgi:hypothetical protein